MSYLYCRLKTEKSHHGNNVPSALPKKRYEPLKSFNCSYRFLRKAEGIDYRGCIKINQPRSKVLELTWNLELRSVDKS